MFNFVKSIGRRLTNTAQLFTAKVAGWLRHRRNRRSIATFMVGETLFRTGLIMAGGVFLVTAGGLISTVIGVTMIVGPLVDAVLRFNAAHDLYCLQGA